MSRKRETTKLLDSKPLKCFFVQAGFGTAFTCLTGGTFLSGFAIFMGAGDLLVNYLSVIINICGILVLRFSAFFERFPSRKKLTIVLTALSKLMTLFIVAIPALAEGRARLVLFIPATIVAFTLQAQTTVVLNQWLLEFMDSRKSGRYISLRQTLTVIVTVIFPLVGGFWMDYMEEKKYIGFVFLFVVAGFMGLCEVLILLRTPDGKPYVSADRKFRLRDAVKIPLKDKKFAAFVCYITLFYLLLYISDSNTANYMLKYLEMPYKTVTALSMIMSLPQILLVNIWGRISDRWGHDIVLRTSIWFFVGETLFMSMVAPTTWHVFIPAAFFMSAIGNAGFVISVFNRRYQLMPGENRILYDNFFTAAVGVGFILGPMIGEAVQAGVRTSTVLMGSMVFADIRLRYFIAAAGILLLQIISLLRSHYRKQSEGTNF